MNKNKYTHKTDILRQIDDIASHIGDANNDLHFGHQSSNTVHRTGNGSMLKPGNSPRQFGSDMAVGRRI